MEMVPVDRCYLLVRCYSLDLSFLFTHSRFPIAIHCLA